MTDIIILAILLVILGAAIAYIVRAKKNGARCIGCSSGSCSRAKMSTGYGCSCGSSKADTDKTATCNCGCSNNITK